MPISQILMELVHTKSVISLYARATVPTWKKYLSIYLAIGRSDSDPGVPILPLRCGTGGISSNAGARK